MTANHLYCLITMEKSSLSQCKHSSSSSFPLFGLVDFFLIVFFRWFSFTQIILFRFCPLLEHPQCVSEKKSKDLEVQSLIKHDDGLCIEDAEMVMQSLGLFTDPEREGLQKRYSSKELSNLFEDKEPSLEEVKQAFDVFDENRDGFLDPIDLQRILTILGLKQGSNLENCRRMIRSFEGNKDGRIDFHGFVKFMENNFC
ncbi:putative calcium-binding protein CML45 [Raphanus sativus]|uniref:Probable calcium-binding protein CML46 n=1 Tax=Raphanus sativus TaxID=3726 RepID=A0A9W3C6F8_RAPSA|nr:probable calcium-binding protein CML46 [Raphanus sativus]KAJ4885390.1 putative calcium-binding protein CML45 [Raphanus sativus]